MTTIFLSGSRKINRLNSIIESRLRNIVEKGFNIIVGDATGADKTIQKYFLSQKYKKVTVFCAGNTCRNNVGDWTVENVVVDSKLKGRDFYTAKDKVMATKADYGFVLWDGESPGSFNNIIALLKREKQSLVYFAPNKEFHTISTLTQAKKLLKRCNEKVIDIITKKIHLNASIREIEQLSQISIERIGFGMAEEKGKYETSVENEKDYRK